MSSNFGPRPLVLLTLYLVVLSIATTGVASNTTAEEKNQGRQQLQQLKDHLVTTSTSNSNYDRSYLSRQTQATNADQTMLKYGCNEVIATIHPSEVLEIVNTFLTNIPFPPTLSSGLGLQLTNELQYGVQVKTVCAACSTIETSFKDLMNADYKRYCGKDVYGYDSQQSGLVMIPLVEEVEGDDSVNLVELSGTLSTFIFSRGTGVNKFVVPSQEWSTTANGHMSLTLFPAFLATSIGGKVSIIPDFMGYGLSDSGMGYLIRDAYVTNMLPLWKKVSSDLRHDTNCKTVVGDAAFLEGYSEGGYATVAIAEGLHRALGIDIVQARTGGAPFRPEILFLEIIKSIKAGYDLFVYWYLTILGGGIYSSTNPSVANYNKGQNVLKDEYLYTLDWLDEPTITKSEINARILAILNAKGLEGKDLHTEFWMPDMMAFFEGAIAAGVDNPCDPSYSGYEVGVNDMYCEAFQQNDLTEVLHNVKYPVYMCHSIADELVSIKSLPDVTLNPDYLTVNELSTGLPHAFAFLLTCYVDDILYLTSPQFKDYVPESKHSDVGCSTCVDSPLVFKTTKKNDEDGKIIRKKCEWAKEKSTNFRCRFKGVAVTCPETCGTCQRCVDSPLRIEFKHKNKKMTKSCEWVKKWNKLKRCKIAGIKETCRKTCGTC